MTLDAPWVHPRYALVCRASKHGGFETRVSVRGAKAFFALTRLRPNERRHKGQARSAAQNPFCGETILPGCERGCFARKIDKKGFWTKRALPRWCPLKNHTPKIRNSARQTRFISAFTETAPAIGFHENIAKTTRPGEAIRGQAFGRAY